MWVIVLTEQWRGLLRFPMLSRDSWPNRVVPRVSSTDAAYDWASSQSVSWPALTILFELMLFSLKASTTTECSFHWHEVAVAHFFHLSWTGTPAFLLCNFSNFSSGSTRNRSKYYFILRTSLQVRLLGRRASSSGKSPWWIPVSFCQAGHCKGVLSHLWRLMRV